MRFILLHLNFTLTQTPVFKLKKQALSKLNQYNDLKMYLNIPVLVEIVDTRDAASITVRVVNMADVPCPVSWVTGNHALDTKDM